MMEFHLKNKQAALGRGPEGIVGLTGCTMKLKAFAMYRDFSFKESERGVRDRGSILSFTSIFRPNMIC